jgi:hypothetical protein
MSVTLIKSMWGVVEGTTKDSWRPLLERVKREGYNAIEFCAGAPAFGFAEDPAYCQSLVKELGLRVVVLVITCGYPKPSAKGGQAAVDAHLACLLAEGKAALAWEPLYVNCHGGKDSFTLEQSLAFFRGAVAIEQALGVQVCHETHRQTILCNPFVYRDLMPLLPPEVKITADLSHWAVSLERCMSLELDDEFWPAVLGDLAARVVLIHARVGWSQSPQVADPEAPEHASDVEAHVVWWDAIVAGMRRRGLPTVAIEPEFGPYPYMPALPHTVQPVAELWAIRRKFGNKLRERYESK